MSLAFSADLGAANGWYRAHGPLEALEARGHRVRALNGRDVATGRALTGVDVLLVHRSCDAAALGLVQSARARGVAVVWDDDDDFSAIPRRTASYKHHGGMAYERRAAALRKLLPHVDVATAPSERITAHLQAMGAARVQELPNYVPDAFVRAKPQSHAGFTIGWVAGLEHRYDYDALGIRQQLEALLDVHPALRVSAIGVGLGLPGDRCVHERLVPFGELPARIGMFDVALAPLADIPFNHARSDIKVKEYTAVGVPWLASPIGPYRGLGEREGGRLVADDRWFEEINRMIIDTKAHRQAARRAERWGSSQTVSQNAHQWETLFTDLVRARRA
ncbi:hypothetical protein [Conexibacter sp. CPCC 206217]|uniref:hypothetical protein n=1 Tax=Conexibacter sp. CPCC 206217 TaxID=3064574 RepID=UPI00271747AE|nr:hypothetical protein [Conexibacter sp. CPCC 206217]MDO8213038.1 hypothetical protein [Conexibacter sp. CPCC 206217]